MELRILTLVVGACEQLRAKIIGSPDESLALELANHVIRHLDGNVPDPGLYDCPSMRPLDGIVLVVLPQPALVLLDLEALVGQLGYASAKQRRGHNGISHLLGEARVEDGAADEAVVGAPAGARHVQRDLAEESQGLGPKAGHVLHEDFLIVAWTAVFDIAPRLQSDLVAQDLQIGRRVARRLVGHDVEVS